MIRQDHAQSNGHQDEHGKPLQLIILGRRNDFERSLEVTLDNHVLDTVLKTCGNRKICVIAVAGAAQSGKGFLLNCLMARLVAAERNGEEGNWLSGNISGFQYNHGYKTVHDGIWIWSRAFVVKDEDEEEIAILLMESEGFHDEFTKPDEISTLLGISLLTSSIAVLNFTGNIPKEAFDWMETVFEFGDLLRSKGFQEPFQNLSFLVRDWTRLCDYSYGETSGMNLLTKMMKANRKVGQSMEKCWEDIGCFLLPHIGGQALMQSFEGSSSDLSEDFSKIFQTYVNKLTDPEDLPLKKVLGNALTAGEWKQCLAAYVGLFTSKSEMECGLQPDSIWRTTMETTGRIMLDRAVNAYGDVFRQRKVNSGGYFREASIDGLHIQAKRKAVEMFAESMLPKEEEKYFQGKLNQLLEEEKEKMRKENHNARTTIVTEYIRQAGDKLRGILEFKFPFTPEHGESKEMVFYQEPYFHQELQSTVEDAKQTFLDNFSSEDEVELRKLEGTLSSVIQPIVDGYLEKNGENHKRVINMTKEVASKLTGDYRTAMNDLIEKLPQSSAEFVRYLHDKEIKTLEEKFQQLKIGSTSFQQQCLEELVAELEDEYETIETNLEWTMNEALEMVQMEEQKYREDLTEKADSIRDDDDIQEYHQNARTAILKRFAISNPLRKDVSRGEWITETLEAALNKAYIEIVEEGAVAQRNLEEQFKEARNAAVEFYKQEMSNSVDDEGDFILEEENFSKINEECQNDAFDQYEEKITLILGVDDHFRDEEQAKLEGELTAAANLVRCENGRKRELAESEANALYMQCNQDFETKLTAAASQIRQREDLVQQFQQMQGQAFSEFNKNCKTKNKEVRRKYIAKLVEKAAGIFDDVEEFFNMQRQTENVGIMAALVEAKQVYFQNMEGYFRNKASPSYFSEDELRRLHENLVKMGLDAVNVEPPLSTGQMEEVKNNLNKLLQKYRDRNELIWRSYENEDIAIGIDLGTTYCCVAAYHSGKVQVLRNTLGDNTTPSYVTINSAENTTTCGKSAKELAFEFPESTIYDAKRIIGRRMDDKNLQQDMKFWPFTVKEVGGVPKVEVDGNTFFPEQISAELLKHLKEEAEEILGRSVTKAVITVPAYFSDAQRKATIDAGEIARLEVLGILNEPTAAAVAYRNDWYYADDARKILIFDLGGGTFDVVVMEMSQDKIEVLSIGGDDHLGGQDFDKKLMEFCAENFKQTTGIDLFQGKDSDVRTERNEARLRIRRLQAKCEEVKKQLTNARSKGKVSIPSFFQRHNLIVDVTREQFERQNDSLFQKTLSIVDNALASAGLQKEDVDEIVMVGGSTRIPKVEKMLQEHFNGKVLNKKINPDEAVAHGAAIQAAILNAKPGEKVFDFGRIQEVTPMSLGIEVVTKDFNQIIPKNTKIPVEFTRTYHTCRNFQTNTWIKIFQGENPIAVDNKLLGHFLLDGIPPGRAGKEAVDVTMKIDSNGILTVEAVCKSTGGKNSITVSEQQRGRMTEEEKQRLIQQAQRTNGSSAGDPNYLDIYETDSD